MRRFFFVGGNGGTAVVTPATRKKEKHLLPAGIGAHGFYIGRRLTRHIEKYAKIAIFLIQKT